MFLNGMCNFDVEIKIVWIKVINCNKKLLK
jgi:hypothetical protein